jgi:signal transduction histidine kinase
MLITQTLEGPVYLLDQPVRMLVVDDDPILREFAVGQLSMPGGTILTARDGEEAWHILNTGDAFDLVLSDLEMPKLNGFGLVDRIRCSPRHAHLPVVVITSRDDMFAIDRAYEVGATSFVTKPVNWRLLGYQLRYVLRASRLEAEIRSARDQAQRAAELKNSLLTLIQHETRTPLHAIIGYSELLLNAVTEPASSRDHLAGVLAAAKELNDLLRSIFYFSQLSSGTLPLERETAKLSDVVDEIVCSVRARATEAGVVLQTRHAAHVETIISYDVRHFSNAVRELLVNALRHSPKGATVEITSGRDATGDAAILINDQGPGLDCETLKHCREPFVQAGDPLTRAGTGLGLGLATAQRIIELHGGRLELTSTPGQGTCARIVLPLVTTR